MEGDLPDWADDKLITHLVDTKNPNDNNIITTAVRITPHSLFENIAARYERCPSTENCSQHQLYMNGSYPMEQCSNYVFGTSWDQERVAKSVELIFHRFIQGYNIGFVATGPPGSGKSYTIFGPGFDFTNSEAQYGILPRLVSHVFGNMEGLLAVQFSAIEIVNGVNQDLFDRTNKNKDVLITNEGFVNLVQFTKRNSTCAREAMAVIQEIMSSRTYTVTHPTYIGHQVTLYVSVEITKRTPDKKIISCQAAFVDMEAYNNTHESRPYGVPAVISSDLWILRAILREMHSVPWDVYEATIMKYSQIYLLLKDFFATSRVSCVIACTPTIGFDRNEPLISMITSLYMWNESAKYNLLMHPDVNVRTSQNNFHLSLMMPKRKPEEIAHDMSHLARIEEVTESEEDIASSNEKMCESVRSMTNLCCESDQDEAEAKYQSDNDFFENLDSFIIKFKDSVDSFVETFKVKADVNRMNGRYRSCSTARRGAVSSFDHHGDRASGGVSPVSHQVSASVSIDNFFAMFQKPSNQEESARGYEKQISKDQQYHPHLKPNSPACELFRYMLDPEYNCKVLRSFHGSIRSDHIWGSNIACGEVQVEEEQDSYEMDHSKEQPDSNVVSVKTLLENTAKKLADLQRKWMEFGESRTSKSESTYEAQFAETPKRMTELEIKLRESLMGLNAATNHVAEVLSNSMSTEDYVECRKMHKIRELRMIKAGIDELRMDTAPLNDESLFPSPESGALHKIVGEELVIAIDTTIEYLNQNGFYRSTSEANYYTGGVNEKMRKEVKGFLDNLKIDESRNLLDHMFHKLVETKFVNQYLDKEVQKAEVTNNNCNSRIIELLRQVDGLRSEVDRLEKLPPPLCRRPHTSNTNALALPSRSSKAERPSPGGATALIPQQNLNKLLPVKSPQAPKSCFIDKCQRKLVFTNKTRRHDK